MHPKQLTILGILILFCAALSKRGACLTLGFVTRNVNKYGGVTAFTVGLIGDKIYSENYKGDPQGTLVFICTSNPDPHIQVERVYATSNILRDMNASVIEKIYNNMGHTINQDEIKLNVVIEKIICILIEGSGNVGRELIVEQRKIVNYHHEKYYFPFLIKLNNCIDFTRPG